jgi:hypothetical protein
MSFPPLLADFSCAAFLPCSSLLSYLEAKGIG